MLPGQTVRIFLISLVAAAGWMAHAPAAGPAPTPAVPPQETAAANPDLRPETTAAFEQHVAGVEAAVEDRVSGRKNFLWLDDEPKRRLAARGGKVVVERTSGTGPVEVSHGLVHDFVGAVFIPRATVAQTLAFVQDYDHHKTFYGPEVADARIVSREGDHFVIDMRLRKHKVITVVLNTRHDAQFFKLDPGRWHSRSKTRKVGEIQDPDSPGEKEQPPGYGHGFMWALNSYWRFLERDGGTYVECQAVSLSRAIPWGLGWIIGPIVNDLPKDSLENTLAATRAGVLQRAGTSK
jgi:hypothetical protein